MAESSSASFPAFLSASSSTLVSNTAAATTHASSVSALDSSSEIPPTSSSTNTKAAVSSSAFPTSYLTTSPVLTEPSVSAKAVLTVASPGASTITLYSIVSIGSSSSGASAGSTAHMGTIIGCVAGVAVVIVVALGVGFFLYFRRRSSNNKAAGPGIPATRSLSIDRDDNLEGMRWEPPCIGAQKSPVTAVYLPCDAAVPQPSDQVQVMRKTNSSSNLTLSIPPPSTLNPFASTLDTPPPSASNSQFSIPLLASPSGLNMDQYKAEYVAQFNEMTRSPERTRVMHEEDGGVVSEEEERIQWLPPNYEAATSYRRPSVQE